MATTPNLLLPLLEESAATTEPQIEHNKALRYLDALVQCRVKDRDLTAPPGSPAEGDRYLPKAPATGAWAGKENNLAAFIGGIWVFWLFEGLLTWVDDENKLIIWNGTIYKELTQV